MENQEEQGQIQARTLRAPARDREAESEIREEIEQDTPALPDLIKALIERMDRLTSLEEESNVLKERELLMKTGSIAQPSSKAQEKRILVEEESNWVENHRALLIGVATAIACMATRFVVSPPGGVWQDAQIDPVVCTPSRPCIPGTAIASYVQPVLFKEFIMTDCLCFAFSMNVILFLLCGFPSNKRAIVWIYTVLMCLTLFFLSITTYKAISLC